RHTPAGRLDLAHAFLREVLLEGLDATQRRGWHQRWAEHLRRRDDDAVLLAEQSLAAAEGAGAREDLLAAAEQLFARWQYAGAARFFQAAVDRMAPEDPARLEVYPRLARAWREAHDAPALERVCRDWVETAELLGDLAARSTALSKLASALRERGQGAQAQRLAREAIELAEQADDPRAAALANKVLASILWAGWEHSSALAPFERALHLAEQTGDQRELAYSLQDVALPYAITGRSAAAIEASRKAQKLFQQLGDRVWELLARTNETLVYTRLGDLQAARQLSESMIEELSDVPGIPVELAMENLVFLLNRMGLYERTLELGQRLIEHAAIVGRHGPRIAALLAMGEALIRLGDTRSAREHHRLARDLAEALGEERQLLFAELAIAADLRRSRRIEQARRRAEQVREQARPIDARRQLILASIELARLARLAGEPSRSLALLDDADNQLFQSGEDGPALRAQLLFERARGWKELGQEGLLLACAEEGAGLASRHGPVEIEVRLLALAAEVYESQGQSQRAAQHLTRAAQTLRELAGEIHDESRRALFLSDPERSAILLRADRLEPIGSGADSTSTLARLYEVCEEITRGGQLEDLLERVVALAVESCGAERGLLLLRDEGTKELTLAAGCDLDGGRGEGLEFSQSVQARVEQEGAVLIADVRSDPDLGRVPSVSALGIRSLMGVALRMEGRDLGTLYVDSRANRTLFSSQDLRLLQALADQAAVALAYGRLVGKVAQQRDAHYKAAARTYRFGNLVSLSKSMRRVFELLEKAADTDVPVIVLGESGTGKEVISRAMHFASRRREKVFLSENCAAIPETLLESILFGHVRGAFTGADRDRPGLFELANGGTLLLDEVGEMSPGLQAKLLRVLQEKEFRPLGSDRVVATDVRIIAATHQDLGARVAEGSFRQDLYFRLNGVTIQLPPLRNRREDIPLLVRHFLEREAAAARRPVPRMTAAVMRLLCSHDWPGNIRELENTVRRLLLVSEDDLIGTDALATDPHFALSPSAATSRDIGSGGFKASPADPEEKQRLEEALEQAGGNRGRAAALLGISRATLYRRLRRFGIGRN
ncbi:MAG TPA: GAF domain-containing protein, partial [Acidobacteria bacterium]|nr:GAF domain-containing protein [Acidobacteriota bacterium]